MRFKLAFDKTLRGNLRVTTMAAKGSDYVLSIYDDDEAFVRLLEHSGLDKTTVSSMKSLAHQAFDASQMPTSSDDVELSTTQLTILRLGTARTLYP
jgi:hypothetical protein